MIHKLNGLSRRILTYPAVHPCESISPSTLLSSVIDLARDILGYKSKFFATNKENARQTIRHVDNLLLFLQDIRYGSSDPPDAVVLSLSELHLTFQKLRSLLEDCTREGARVWMFVKSERVTVQFRILVRAIAMGLDVFPFGSVDISSEVKELVELIMRQSRKAIFESDPKDKRALKDLMRILNQFQEGIAPDQGVIKRVLNHLGIRRWSECNKEVKFLDTEMAIEEYTNAEKEKEKELLSSLMAFMSYCRCMMFEFVDSEETQRPSIKCNSEMLKAINSDDLRCPISLEIMSEPVTLSTGHTYDRGSITKWFKSGNATCPKTGEKLATADLVPNLALKGIIQQYCVENGVAEAAAALTSHIHKNRDAARSLAAEGAVKVLAAFLANKLAQGSVEEMNKAAFEIRVLTKASIFNRSCLVEAGTIPLLLKLLLWPDSNMQENAIAALLNLSKYSKSNNVIVENGGMDLIVHVLRNGLKTESQHHAAAALFYLSSVEEYRILIGENPDAIPCLIDLLTNANYRGNKNALVAILGLLAHSENHWRVLAAGAVPLLLNILKNAEREDLVTNSLAVLASLAEKVDGTVAILRRGALQLIVGILDTSTSRAAKEFCVSLLLALCTNGGLDVVARLVKSPSLMGSLYSQLSEGTSRASRKASSLLRVLHEFHERRSSSASVASHVLPRERFVHVW